MSFRICSLVLVFSSFRESLSVGLSAKKATSEAEISAELAGLGGSPEERLSRLQSDLKCGTNCGSCVPELKRMIRLQPYAVGEVAALQGTLH